MRPFCCQFTSIPLACPFASSRLRVSPFLRTRQISGWKARATCIRVHSCFIRQAVESHPWVTALTSVLWLQPQRRAAPSPSGETELSRHPRHATAADGDSDLPLPHTRDATTLLYSTAYDDN